MKQWKPWFHLKPWLLMNWNRPAVSAGEKLLRKKLYICIIYTYTNIDKVKIFYVIHNEVALLTRKCSERGTRNCHQRMFRKVLTIN